MLVRLANPSDLESTKRWLAANPSLGVVCERQSDYYLRQSSGSTAFLVTIAWLCGGIMALGALFGSVKILYSVVGARTTEIATLRAVGYDASSVAASVVVEGLVLSLTGAALGACLAWLLFDGRQVMRDWIFHLFVPFRLIALGLGWAVLISLLGSVFPAMRAARLPVAQALRAT
jgi:putative ABC transport system permease protein